jgi:hypothetical protein
MLVVASAVHGEVSGDVLSRCWLQEKLDLNAFLNKRPFCFQLYLNLLHVFLDVFFLT